MEGQSAVPADVGRSAARARRLPMLAMSNVMSAEADVLRCGYNVGFFDKSDVEAWADRQIEASTYPCTELLDLSMTRQTHPLDVMNLLRSFGPPDPATTIQTQIGFIGLLLAKNKISTELAIRGLWSLVHEPGTTHEQQSQIYCLDDGYDLAVAGTYGTMDDIERELHDFVSPYAEQLSDAYPHLIPSVE